MHKLPEGVWSGSKDLIKLVLVIFVYAIVPFMQIDDIVILMLYFGLNSYISQRLRICLFLLFTNRTVPFLSRPYSVPILCIELIVIGIMLIFSTFSILFDFYSDCFIAFLSTFFVWICFRYTCNLQKSEIFSLQAKNNLLLGQGAALWYYKNYIEKVVVANIVPCIRQFENEEGNQIKLPHKLFILCPWSCNIHALIDDKKDPNLNDRVIQRCRELILKTDNYGGVVGRKYKVTAYCFRNPKIEDPFYCVLEFPQPLNNLFRFKEQGKLSLDEMGVQRSMFCKSLLQVFNDTGVSDRFEIIEYDDKNIERSEVWKLFLTEENGVQAWNPEYLNQ